MQTVVTDTDISGRAKAMAEEKTITDVVSAIQMLTIAVGSLNPDPAEPIAE